MTDDKRSSPSEELLRAAGGADADYDPGKHGDETTDTEVGEGGPMSAEEIAAELAGTDHGSEPKSTSTDHPGAAGVPSSELDAIRSELDAHKAKRDSRSVVRRWFSSARVLVPLGIAIFFLAGLVFSLLDGKEALEDQTVGDCFIGGDAEVLEEVEVVDCSEPHEGEVLSVIDASAMGALYLDEAQAADWLFERCLDYFEPYTGQSYEESDLWIAPLLPTAESWRDGLKDGFCVIVAVDDSLNVRMISGSARDPSSQS